MRESNENVGTEGPVSREKNYVVSRTTELTDFIDRIKQGKYLIIFAPRQTGKTTFFQFALDMLVAEDPTYVPIELNFEAYVGVAQSIFIEASSRIFVNGCHTISKNVEPRQLKP